MRLSPYIVIGLSLFIAGCGSNEVIRPDNLHNYSNHDIVVHMPGGKQISLKAGEYTVESTPDGRSISGSGIIISDSLGPAQQKFSGNIRFDEIEEIRIADSGEPDNVIKWAVIIGLPIAVIIWFASTYGAH